jgi:hypothetical protein
MEREEERKKSSDGTLLPLLATKAHSEFAKKGPKLGENTASEDTGTNLALKATFLKQTESDFILSMRYKGNNPNVACCTRRSSLHHHTWH